MALQIPVLGITMGDPAGVGPEITAKALARPDVTAACRPVVIGDAAIMAATLAILRSPLRLHAVKRVGDCAFAAGTLECLDLANVDAAACPAARSAPRRGAPPMPTSRRRSDCASRARSTASSPPR